MDPSIDHALAAGGIADITTTGRRTGLARRIEIVFHSLDGDLYITGRPGTRDWYANLLADPAMTLHLKRGVAADLAATATPVTGDDTRRELLTRIMTDGFGIPPDDVHQRLPAWVADAPLVALTLIGSEASAP